MPTEDQSGEGQQVGEAPRPEDIICIFNPAKPRDCYQILSLDQGEVDGKLLFNLRTFSVGESDRNETLDPLLDNFQIDKLPVHLQPGPQRRVHVIVSTHSGTGLGLQFYNNILAPLFEALGLTAREEAERGAAGEPSNFYHLLITQNADSVKEFTRGLLNPGRSDENVEHTVVLLSGDGGIVDMLNSYMPPGRDDIKSEDDVPPERLPLLAVLPLGTGNALFNSMHKTVKTPMAATDLIQGLRTLLHGKAAILPSFKAVFPEGSRTIAYSESTDPASTANVSANPIDSVSNLQEQKSYVSHLYGVVVASYGFHSQLVWESDTPSYRKHGDKRFQMVAEELLKESHAYQATVEVARITPSGEPARIERIDRSRHAYVLATLVSNLEKTFCISPASHPMDGHLRLVHFEPVDGAKTMEIMMAAYDEGKHLDMRWETTVTEGEGHGKEAGRVGYEDISEVRITTHEEDARWRKSAPTTRILRKLKADLQIFDYLIDSQSIAIMTSMEAESVTTILCTSKQTRFHIGTPNYRELDIEGLNIIVRSGGPGNKGTKSAKGKTRVEGTEILDNATLRLKAGQRYALVGRNGSGKSTLLKAIVQKLIPGIPEETRIVILQQTNAEDGCTTASPEQPMPPKARDLCVLDEVIERATARYEVQNEIEILSHGIDSNDPLDAVRSLRKIQRERLQKDLFLKAKDAKLRSGARGMQARKALIAAEKKTAEFDAIYGQTGEEDISPETLAKETSEAADLLADLQLTTEPSKAAEVISRAKKLLTGLGFTEATMLRPVSSLSGGWKMRTSLAAASMLSSDQLILQMLQESDILILDEPTNFLDLLGILWLQRYLLALSESSDPPTLILVSHDRDFASLCTDLLILRDKDITYFHGDLPTYESAQAEKKIHLSKMKEAQDRQKDHIQQTIQKNMREGRAKDDQNKIKQAKSRQKKLDERWGLETSAKGGRFKLNRDLPGYYLTSRAEIEIPQDERPVNFVLPEPSDLRFPGSLISLDKAAFRYLKSSSTKTGSSPVVEDVTLSVHMGDRIGILGLNGSGKSTLVKLLVGETKPNSGVVTLHSRLKIGYYSQQAVEKLQELGISNPDLSALSLLQQEMSSTEKEEGRVRGLLGSLGLPGRLASEVPIRKLSGGQLVRLEMARIVWRNPHCLILDEATTHLDYETVIAFREALRDWEGAVVVVSHDRWFMRGVVEGRIEDEDEGSDLSDDEGQPPRRRLVYRLRAGKLSQLDGGVDQFEAILEKRVAKLSDS
ncbi:P-loop containing nucleoside triphosphate hydrolase protein [Astrocystis sublimbata]|nr:P-loop containing nucleoside triphosphate hydrolase protein [Astrocystis sublimbata]